MGSYATNEEIVEEYGNRFVKKVIRGYDNEGKHRDTLAISAALPISRVDVDRFGRLEVYTRDDKGKEWKIIRTKE